MQLRRVLLIWFLLLLTFSAIVANASPAERPLLVATDIEDLGWLEGRWVGSMGESVIEEHWSAPEGNTIIGMFRLVKAPAEGGDAGAARIGFSEFWTVEPGPHGPRLFLRHFSPGLVGWEDKESPLVFEPVATGERSITWEVEKPEGKVRLAYRSPDPDTLIAELHEPDGSTPTFTYKRAK